MGDNRAVDLANMPPENRAKRARAAFDLLYEYINEKRSSHIPAMAEQAAMELLEMVHKAPLQPFLAPLTRGDLAGMLAWTNDRLAGWRFGTKLRTSRREANRP